MPCRQSFDTLVPAVPVRLDRNPFHHGTLGAARSLGRAGIQVHAAVESPTSPVTRSRHLRSARVRHGTDSSAELAALLTRIADEITDDPSHPLLPIPLDDVSALALARRRSALSPRLLLPEQTEEQLLRVADKAALAGTCAALGLPHPRTRIPTGADEPAAMARSLGLPVVAKWSRPWLLPAGGGLRSTSVLRSLAEVRELYARTPEAGSRLLLHGGPRAAAGAAPVVRHPLQPPRRTRPLRRPGRHRRRGRSGRPGDGRAPRRGGAAAVRIVARGNWLNWNTLPPAPDRGLWPALRNTGLGCG